MRPSALTPVHSRPPRLTRCFPHFPVSSFAQSGPQSISPFEETAHPPTRDFFTFSAHSCATKKIQDKNASRHTLVLMFYQPEIRSASSLDKVDLRVSLIKVGQFSFSPKDYMVVSFNCFLWSGFEDFRSHPFKGKKTLISKPHVNDYGILYTYNL